MYIDQRGWCGLNGWRVWLYRRYFGRTSAFARDDQSACEPEETAWMEVSRDKPAPASKVIVRCWVMANKDTRS